jgi:hypothetical protein
MRKYFNNLLEKISFSNFWHRAAGRLQAPSSSTARNSESWGGLSLLSIATG